MGKKSYLAMRTEQETSDLIVSDIKDLSKAAKKLANHAIKLVGLGFGTSFLEWLASFAAMYASLSLSSSLLVMAFLSVLLECLFLRISISLAYIPIIVDGVFYRLIGEN